MALKNVKRYTISLPKTVIVKLEARIPKSRRSKFIAATIAKELDSMEEKITLEETERFWDELNEKYPLLEPMDKSVVEMLREDRMSH